MAKSNPFIKRLSVVEQQKLERLRPYVARLYNPETNEVNYQEALQRLKRTDTPLLDEEREVLGQLKRNLQREFWRQAITQDSYVKGETPHRKQLQQRFFETRRQFIGSLDSTYGDIAKSDFGFDKYNSALFGQAADWGIYEKYAIRQFMPEDFSIYENINAYGKEIKLMPQRKYNKYAYPTHRSADSYYDRANAYAVNKIIKAYDLFPLSRPIRGLTEHWTFLADREEPRKPGFATKHQLHEAINPLRNMDTLKSIFDQIDTGIKAIDDAPKKAQEAEEARQRAERERRQRDLESQISLLNSRYETSLVDHQKELENQRRLFEQMRAEDSAKFQKELEALRLRSTEEIASERSARLRMGHRARELELARDESEKRRLAYETMSEQRLSELRKDLLSRQEEQAKRDAETALRLKELKEGMDQDRIARETERARLAEEHKMELANLQGKLSVAAQTLEAERAEKARMKKQSELFMRNVLRRRNMRNAGSLNLHFLGEGQPDSPYRSNELLFIGDNRYVPSMTQLNTMGRAIRTDTAVPDIFQSMLRQNRPNQQRRR